MVISFRFLHLSPQQARPSFGHVASFVGCRTAIADAGSRPGQARSSPSFRSQAMHPPPPSPRPPSEGRDWRGRKTMEETMRVLTLTELMRLSKIELCDLLARITNLLPDFPEGSVECEAAHINLRNIRT